MYNLTYEQITNTILSNSNLTKEELENKINLKLKELSDLISREGAAHIIANELGIKLITVPSSLKIENVLPGMRLVTLTAKVINIYETREFTKNEKKSRVSSMLIGDETGTTRLVIWDDVIIKSLEQLKEDDIIKIKGAYCKENNGFKEVHLGNNSQLLINPEGEFVGNVLVRQQLTRKKISELTENDNVELLGTVVQLFEPRFYDVCPECNKSIKLVDGNFRCEKHNIVTPKHAPLINFFFDDSSANIRVVVFRDQALRLVEKTEEELRQIKESPQKFDILKSEVLGKQLLIKGRVTRNDMFNRLEFVANNIQEANPVEIAENMIK